MKTLRPVTLILTCLFAFTVSSTASAAGYKVKAVADGGSISGRITLNGTAPAPKMLVVDEDVEACGGNRPSDELLVSGSGGIQNVVLSIENIDAGKDWDFPNEFVYDQKGCTFVTRVMLIKPKMAGAVTNSDTVGHNFHTISKGVFNINKKIQPGSQLTVADNKIRKSGIVEAKCDIHGWMGGAWVVAESPYAVISDKDGNFSISDIPPGSYTLNIWHETLGESKQKFDVKAGAATAVDVALKL